MAGSAAPKPPNDFQIDLLVKQVTEGLTPAEARVLESIDGAVRERFLGELEQAAAALTVAGSARLSPLPEALRERIEAQAPLQARRARAGRLPMNMAGWWAAAACLCIALFTWVRSPTTSEAQLTPQLTSEEQRAALLAGGTRKITVTATQDKAAVGASGDVVWDPVTQRGFLHVVGLAHNDRAVNQYQIWIFDADRDERYPVDGGVFDVPADATDVVVPIRAALNVRNAKAFAVTVEKPGGVVVSGRERVVALAQAG